MSQASQLNFKPLQRSGISSKKSPFIDRATARLPQGLNWTIKIFYILGAMLFYVSTMLGFGLGLWFVLLKNIKSPIVAFMVYFTILTLLSVWAGKRNRLRQTKKYDAIAHFARANNWRYGPGGTILNDYHYSKLFTPIGQPDVELKSIQGTFSGHSFELLVGWKTKGYFESLSPELVIKVKKSLPQAVLVSRKLIGSGEGGFIDKLYINFSNIQPLQLEGDFNKSFSLYVPKGKHIEAMSVIAPDVMEAAKNLANDFVITFSGNFMSLMSYAPEANSASIMRMFAAAEELISKIN
jgi:hypothetical protein